ncbi:uncharacterized protein [Rutidosis leptorrhynchoides]|uniref:uncharacterized protein n=1 Tax=Rutidosis leptorrhynchoides TaxID=125765 RepID=UPI003A99A408
MDLSTTRKRRKVISESHVGDGIPMSVSGCVTSLSSSSASFRDDVALRVAPSYGHSAGVSVDFNQIASSLENTEGVTNAYGDLGDCNCVCSFCGATFWYEEMLKISSNALKFNRCIEGGRVDLPREDEPPAIFVQLLSNKNYLDNIRAYNQMFSMASYRAHTDDSVNNNRGPYVFKISSQVYHWIGSLCPKEGDPPRFLQLYIYDTVNEVRNRMRIFGGDNSEVLRARIIGQLIEVLNANNELVKLFRSARDRTLMNDVPDLHVRLYSVIGSGQYELPASNAIGAIIFGFSDGTRTDYDMIIEYKGGTPKRINKLHLSYMSLQFSLLFVYGQTGYHPGLKLRNIRGGGGRSKDKMTMNMFYTYQLHDRYNMFGLMSRSGRLFQQYVVTAYCTIELDRLDYVRNNQQNISNEFLSGLYDALSRGDYYGADVGSRTILPASYPGGPRYMYSHYLDALAICRVHGNPKFFITFTCETVHFCPKKMKNYLVPIEPLPDPVTDPNGYKVVADMMMHGHSGLSNTKAPCMEETMQEPVCSKKFPKPLNESTYFDKDGFFHYRRRNLGISADKKICSLDNGYVVPYNRLLCLQFHAHINVEWCGWTMLIKYLFKYISKGTDFIAAHIPKPVVGDTSVNAEQNRNYDEIRNFVDARFICPHEACWRIFNFPIHFREPAVPILSVHLKDMQLVKFRSNQRLRSVVNNPVAKKTTLTEWLFYNRHADDGKHLTYLDFPLEFVWVDNEKRWKRRCNLNKPSIGRLTYMHPAFGEVIKRSEDSEI